MQKHITHFFGSRVDIKSGAKDETAANHYPAFDTPVSQEPELVAKRLRGLTGGFPCGRGI
jgi:hypothetical protein